MNDLISRQAVRLIESDPDAYPQKWNDDYEKGFTDALNKVLALSSAQPEIVQCKDCKWWDKDDNYSYGYCMAMKHGYMSTNWEIGIYRKYKGDFYCADGERGDSDDDNGTD